MKLIESEKKYIIKIIFIKTETNIHKESERERENSHKPENDYENYF